MSNDTDPAESAAVEPVKGGCCSWRRFEGVEMAQGYAINSVARGAIVMSNIFLSSSLVFLANEAAGCLELAEGNTERTTIEDCDGKVFGMSPGPLVANIAVISGVLSAFFMPLIGAILDYTPHRKLVGMLASLLILIIQMAQIGTVSQTWFVMAILQAVAGFLYQVQVMAIYAYLPEMARLVGPDIMCIFQARFTMTQFFAQSMFLIIVILISTFLGFGSVTTGQLSQAINVTWISIVFYLSWRLMPTVPPARQLPEGQSLISAGFIQTKETAVKIYTSYAKSLRWFLLAVVFAEAAVNAFTVVAVIYLDEQLGLNASQIGIFFLTTLLFTLPGSVIGAWVTSKTNPNISLRLVMLILIVITAVGAFVLEKGSLIPAFVWGFGIGMMLGWFYPTEGLFFSVCLPRGQDTEFTGFFVYCTQVLVWLPPLVFSSLVEGGISQRFGVVSITAFLLIAIILLSFLPSWPEIYKDATGNELGEPEAADDVVQEEAIGDETEKESA